MTFNSIANINTNGPVP